MDITVAIRLADEWRKTDACSTSAKVAVALLNELERVQDVNTSAERVQEPFKIHHYEAFTEAVRQVKAVSAELQESFRRERESRALAQAQSKVNDDMLAAQRNLLLREDGYPNAPTVVADGCAAQRMHVYNVKP
jgi:hypothetical protein